MTLWEWLATPGGIEAAHAAIALVVAISAVFSAMATRLADGNRKALKRHLGERCSSGRRQTVRKP